MIEKQNFLELVCHPQLVHSVFSGKVIGRDSDIFVRIRKMISPFGLPVSHLAAAKEVRDKFEPLAVPCIEIRAR